jgi:hypothetical protein
MSPYKPGPDMPEDEAADELTAAEANNPELQHAVHAVEVPEADWLEQQTPAARLPVEGVPIPSATLAPGPDVQDQNTPA